MDEYIVGIDIGSSKVCSAAGKVDKQGRLQIVGVTTVNCNGLKKGIVVDIDNTAESISNCIGQLARMIDTDITNAYISLSGGICELIPSKGVVAISSENREISKNDVQRVLSAAKVTSIPSNKEIIGAIARQYVIDGYGNIKDPIGMSGVKLEVDAHVILSQTTIIENLVKSVNKAGIKVNGIVLEPLAVSQVAVRRDELNMGTVLIDVGSEKIDISIYKRDDIVYTNTIPYGGNTITNDISICLKVPFSEAEKLKLKYGSLQRQNKLNYDTIKVNVNADNTISIDASILKDIIEARVDEFLQMIKINLEDSGYYDDISGIVIVGGGIALFDGVCDLGREVFDKPVRIGAPEYVGASNPVYNTAVGIIKDVVSTSNINEQQRNTKVVQADKRRVSYENKKDSDDNGVLSKIKGFLADFF